MGGGSVCSVEPINDHNKPYTRVQWNCGWFEWTMAMLDSHPLGYFVVEVACFLANKSFWLDLNSLSHSYTYTP